MGRQTAAGPVLCGAAPCTSHSHYLVLFSFIAERLQHVGNKALTAALHRPRVRRAQLDNVGQCGEEAQAGGPFQQPHPQHPQGSHTRESFLGLKGPLSVGRKRSPLELWLFPGLAIHSESPFLWVLQGSPSPSEKPHLSQLPLSTPAPGLTSFLCCPDSQPTRIFQTVCALVFQEVRKNTTLLSDGATGCVSPLDSKNCSDPDRREGGG